MLFQQIRVGKDSRQFRMVKFRSMVPGAEELEEEMLRESGEDPRHPKFIDDPRITRVGRFLRRTSLDELPNLINVVRGEMSLVGPRPPTPREVTPLRTAAYATLADHAGHHRLVAGARAQQRAFRRDVRNGYVLH